MKTYELEFFEAALREWRKLSPDLRDQFAKKLAERLENPHVAADRLRGLPTCYKIKLRSSGYRLIYQVDDDIITVAVVAVGKRERNAAYKTAAKRL